MAQQMTDISARGKARIAGAFYLFIIAAGIFAVGYVPGVIVKAGDAAATAHNILAHETLYRVGLAIHVVITLCNIPVAAIFYDLFRRVSRDLARLVAFFILTAVAIEAVNLFNEFAPLVLLSSQALRAIPAGQLQAQAYAFLILKNSGINISFAFVGCYCITAGWLIMRSRYMPRLVGALLAIGGLCYVANAFANFIAPGFAAGLFPYIQLPSLVGELSLTLWLLVFGRNFEGEAA